MHITLEEFEFLRLQSGVQESWQRTVLVTARMWKHDVVPAGASAPILAEVVKEKRALGTSKQRFDK